MTTLQGTEHSRWRGIVLQSTDARPTVVELRPGQSATFGRSGADILLPDAAVSRSAGVVTAVEDHWVVSNLSARSTYVVENPEGGGEFIKLAPRRIDMPVPFEFARVVVPAEERPAAFFVFAAQHQYADPREVPARGADATRVAFPLVETAKYFLVLVALCEPRLRDSTAHVIRTVPEILERLAGLPAADGLSRAAVNFHIDYLARAKLRVKRPAAENQDGKADWQRAALVTVALQFDLVRHEHLALLPPLTG
ncbi:FHA domain-containing protein [Pseudosporangium ferrugineum]|uniref:FHA domain-containing protein n=1 Tax=Pseudosporangium ferrugineum TaxID=439699 RepID=A0A2T0SB01_9ACTN|nr:FHA domain-containing protein [Pseudosporangium ferrugineum]PRY30604.1 hypothetical protein CLV70_104156 [Pseudosporangium ferrugineum]